MAKFDFDVSDWPKMREALSYAIDIGYRHIDTAHFYRIEPEVGEVINEKIAQGVVKREELFVTTKVWQHFHRESDVEVSLRGSLRRLNLDYVDLLLIHWPMAISEEGVDKKIDYLETWRGFEAVLAKGLTKAIGVSNFNIEQMERLLQHCKVKPAVNQVEEEGVDEKIDYLETWRGFEAVLAKGLTKAIGVSNFNIEQMKRLLQHCKVKPAVNQVEINLTLGQVPLVQYCQQQDIVLVAYSPFGSMVAGRAAADSPPPRLDDDVLLAVAKKHGKTVSQVALRHLYQRGIATIPKTVTKSRVLENASIFDFELDKNDVDKINKFDVGYRTVKNAFWNGYTYYPFDDVIEKIPDLALPLRKWKNGVKSDID